MKRPVICEGEYVGAYYGHPNDPRNDTPDEWCGCERCADEECDCEECPDCVRAMEWARAEFEAEKFEAAQ